MKKVLFLLGIIFSTLLLSAQAPGGMPGGMPGNGAQRQAAPSIGHIYGKLTDSAGKGIGDASVLLLQSRFDTATKKRKDVLLKGMTTQANGDFNFEDLPVFTIYKLKISATGLKPYEQTVSLMPPQDSTAQRPAEAQRSTVSAMAGAFEKDLGKIAMKTDVQQMQNIVVTATTGRLKMDIDKKVFSVDKNIVSAGGTAVDVMKNVPSVNVDIDGNVALRNAPPQIFVDGRPTTLTLDQIPADAIESVEVITNPSAKYDASGGGAGILNIVLKKNRKTGYNGNLRAGVDKLGAVNGGVDFNVRENKVNFFGSLNYNQRKSNTVGSVNRLNLLDSPQTRINQANTDESTGRFIFGRAGLDWFATNRTTISIAGFRASGKFNPYEVMDITTDSLYNGGTVRSFSDRISNGTREFNGRGLALGLKYLFPKAGEEWTADANFFSGKMENNSLYTTNKYANGLGSAVQSTLLQKILGSGTDYNIIMQTDYVNPLSDKVKLEAGLRAAMRGRENNNSNYFFDNSVNAYKLIPSTSSNYKNTDNVYAAYASITNSLNNFGYKLGLRAESSNYNGELTNTGQKFSNNYPISLFPSLFVSQKLGGNQEVQASYTRRINRPNFFQLIPFADYTDELNITQGNPDLKPEFTNSLEASYSKSFPKNNTVLASVYYKKTDNLITRYLEPGTNPFTGNAAIINTYINANSSRSYGTELTSQNYLAKWWDMTTNVNFYNAKINSDDKNVTTDAMWSWFGKWNNNFKLPANFNVQLSATYQSKTQLTPGGNGGFGGPPGARGGGGPGGPGGGFGQAQSASQGYIEPFYGVDIAVRKNFLKNNAASAILSFNDIFRTRSFNQYSESPYFIQTYSRLRDPQMIRLTLTYRFGKMDATLFKRKNTNTESEGGQMQGM
ncbi:MAG: TonB-dependent receptor [Flavisolibacter sp.]|nr:TonB-dependent receptor [Flavisolibacter sp.]